MITIEKSKYLGYTKNIENKMKTIKHTADELIQEIITLSEKLDAYFEELEMNLNGKQRTTVSKDKIEVMKNISEEMKSKTRMLNDYNKALYSRRGGKGKSSLARKTASKENGKKGGRPPKEISEAKKRLEELFEKSEFENPEYRELERKINNWKNEKLNDFELLYIAQSRAEDERDGRSKTISWEDVQKQNSL